MKVTRLSLTTFAVEAESLSCNKPQCRFVTKKTSLKVGDNCPRCLMNQANVTGTLERSTYQVDLEPYDRNGFCGCFHFERKLAPKLDVQSPRERKLFKYRCKHILAARTEAKRDEYFDELLVMLPNQQEQM